MTKAATFLCLRGTFVLMATAGMVAGAAAQDGVLVSCAEPARCNFQRVYAPALNGNNSVTLVSTATTAAGVGRSGRFDRLPGLYKEPSTGVLRVMTAEGTLGDMVLSGKVKIPGGAGPAAAPGWALTYREQAAGKTRASMPADQFVALIRDARTPEGVVQFMRQQAQLAPAHPLQLPLIAGGVLFTDGSAELRLWRDELRGTIRRSLEQFKDESSDPTHTEAMLAEGINAIRIDRLVAPENRAADALHAELKSAYSLLQQRFAIAEALKNAALHDPLIEKLQQIGVARWSRPALVADLDNVLRASAASHLQRAKELFGERQFEGAFDEARTASMRAPCDSEISGLYESARVEFVNNTKVASLPLYDKEFASALQQIVRELQSIRQESSLTPERDDHIRSRIRDGENRDPDYLPLQLKKAEFLVKTGELTAARDVVTRVERTLPLSRTEADEWLVLDAQLNGAIITLRRTTERQFRDQMRDGQFKEALETAERGLRAEPENRRFLYAGAIAAAILRDDARARQFIQRYLRSLGAGCEGPDDRRETLLDISRRESRDAMPDKAGLQPNWMSGQFYTPGDAYYDPTSGSLNLNFMGSIKSAGGFVNEAEFRWEGFLVTSIQTIEGQSLGTKRPVLELEPVYDAKRVYMSAIGGRANSAGQRRIMALRYLNSPDFDPLLAAKFTSAVSTRGWAGNPFFHPFLWDDIYLFDLVYDAQGRIAKAIPVPPDATRPRSPFSEELTFVWEGTTPKLLMITGKQYRREMRYDKRGRLVEEISKHPLGNGRIRYIYEGKAMEPMRVECEDDFYDRGKRIVRIRPSVRR